MPRSIGRLGVIRRSFLAGRTFTDVVDANAQLGTWLAEMNMRRHGTHDGLVHERFAIEQPLLGRLRQGMLICDRVLTRTVDAEGAIVYKSNYYELPRGYRGRELTIRDDGRRLRVFDAGALICEYVLFSGRFERSKRSRVEEIVKRTPSVLVERRALDAYEYLIG